MSVDGTRSACGGALHRAGMPTCDQRHLQAMLCYAQEASTILGSSTEEECASDMRTFFAVSQGVMVVGGAAGQISSDAKHELSHLDWPELISLRERMTAGYRTVTPELVVRVVRNQFPPVITSLSTAAEEDTL